MKVVIGLGNPGPRYEGTRHNVGFAVIDYLAAAPSVSPFRRRFDAQVAEMSEGQQSVLLVKPETFMNLSGRAVRQVVDFYKIDVPDVLVVCDDIALPLGKLRARARGSDGGQKGLRDIEQHLGTQEYSRLRIGVDAPGEHLDAADHVLSRFKPGERAAVEEAIATAAQAVLLWLRQGIDVVMNRVNAGPEKEKPQKEKKDKPEKSTKENPKKTDANKPHDES
jgi:peptidyl-tRNA hydrolase, PTH1 family